MHGPSLLTRFPVQALSLALILPVLTACAALPPLTPFPELPEPQPVDSVPMADSKTALGFKITL